MTPDPLDLARAAVQSPRWRWLDGMLDTEGNRYQWRHVNRQVEACCEDAEGAARWTEPSPGSLPDMDDPATRGCLLALVQEVFGDDMIHPSPATYDRYDTAEPEIRWHVCRHHEGEDEWLRESGAFGAMVDGHRDPPIVGASDVVALVAALLAVPPK